MVWRNQKDLMTQLLLKLFRWNVGTPHIAAKASGRLIMANIAKEYRDVQQMRFENCELFDDYFVFIFRHITSVVNPIEMTCRANRKLAFRRRS